MAFKAYIQAGVRTEFFVKLPVGFGVTGYYLKEHIVSLDKNVYGLKDAKTDGRPRG